MSASTAKANTPPRFFGYGENGKIHKIKEFYDPDSLGGLYGAITEFLGFDMLDGEFKVMGMAPYGDPSKYDLSRLAKFENGDLTINTEYVNVVGLRRIKRMEKDFTLRKSWLIGLAQNVRATRLTTRIYITQPAYKRFWKTSR